MVFQIINGLVKLIFGIFKFFFDIIINSFTFVYDRIKFIIDMLNEDRKTEKQIKSVMNLNKRRYKYNNEI